MWELERKIKISLETRHCILNPELHNCLYYENGGIYPLLWFGLVPGSLELEVCFFSELKPASLGTQNMRDGEMLGPML